MDSNIIINTEKKSSAILSNVVDAKAAAEMLGIKNTAELNEAARQGYIPYVMIGTAYCYDKNSLIDGWKEYQTNAVQPIRIMLTASTAKVYNQLKENNKLTDEQMFKHFISLLKSNQ